MKLKYQVKSALNKLKRRLWANNSPLIKFYYQNIWHPAAGTLSAFLDDFSKNNKNIFFIQVGSNDGIQHDPLSKFIKRDHWQGIMIEPQKEAFRHLSFAYKNENITPLNIAISDIDGSKKLYKIAFSNERWASGISSFLKSQVEAQIDNGHVGRMCKKYGITPPANKADYITYEEVACLSFPTLFERYKVGKVDILHIDTEGFDFEIIKLFDFNRFLPKVVIYEHTHLSKEDKAACQHFLQKKGYAIRTYNADTVAFIS